MATTPEELALELSRASFEAQRQTEIKLRERATAVLSAASLVVPVASVAVSRGSHWAALPLGLAAIAYIVCAAQCCKTLFPKGFATGIAGSEFLEVARSSDADLQQMQASAAAYIDEQHTQNLPTLESAAESVQRAIYGLMAEIIMAAVALVVTLVA